MTKKKKDNKNPVNESGEIIAEMEKRLADARAKKKEKEDAEKKKEEDYEDHQDQLFRLHRAGKTELLGEIFLDQENSGVIMYFSAADRLLHPSDDFISKLKHEMNDSDDPGIRVLQGRLRMVEASRRLQEAEFDLEELEWEKETKNKEQK